MRRNHDDGAMDLGPQESGTPSRDAPDRNAPDDLMRRALARLAANRDRPYYDSDADAAAREKFYSAINLQSAPPDLFFALVALLEDTHRPRPFYEPTEELYPWVDLHPDGRMHNIYSGEHVDAENLIRADAEIAHQRIQRMGTVFQDNPTLGPREFEATFDELESELPFNCEHVVPQSWFAKREPMRGDLHHLFACEPHCNSVRGNTPYADVPASGGVAANCGRLAPGGFEPLSGKGTVARATLYFLLRYRGQIGDQPADLQKAGVATLLKRHRENPAGQYELHRNAAISEVQGNRNPMIDFPALADDIDFTLSFLSQPA
jgi:endonuclease I